MKKKAVSLALALVLCLGLAVPAFAASQSVPMTLLTSAGFHGSAVESVTLPVVGSVTSTDIILDYDEDVTATTVYLLDPDAVVSVKAEWPPFMFGHEAHDNGEGGTYYELVSQVWIEDGWTSRAVVEECQGEIFELHSDCTSGGYHFYFALAGEPLPGFDMNAFKPVEPKKALPTATASALPTNDVLMVNGVKQNPTIFKLDGGDNYFKIRDLAAMLNGTDKEFDITYNGMVHIDTSLPYEPTGSELTGAAEGSYQAAPTNDAVYINGVKIDLTAYKINGSNYFRLRDLGKALDFYVGWSAGQGVFIDTSKPYSE